MSEDIYSRRARALLEEKLSAHPDEGVQVMVAMFGVPDSAVEQIAAKLRQEAKALESLPDEEIDCSDIPETTDWSAAKRGRFYRGEA